LSSRIKNDVLGLGLVLEGHGLGLDLGLVILSLTTSLDQRDLNIIKPAE
jgi:hypothetical protein